MQQKPAVPLRRTVNVRDYVSLAVSFVKAQTAALNPVKASATQSASQATSAATAGRIAALDGLRGLMTLFVLISHYFAEIPNGIDALAVGWIAVLMFFVLSGFLVGRLILEKGQHANFFSVFYIRRCFRTLPVYFFCVIVVYAMMRIVGHAPYMEVKTEFPLWSYLTFTQNVFMAQTGDFGPHWLAPTWTLSVEEQFYLVAPALFIFLPARWLMPALIAGTLFAIVFRAVVIGTGMMPALSALVYLPGCMDPLFLGLAAAVVYKTVNLDRYDFALRVIPLVALAGVVALKLLDTGGYLFEVFFRTIASIGCAAYILCLVRGSPEAASMESRVLCFFGRTSYAVYLTHMMVVGLMHGAILGTAPNIATSAQLAVTVASIPVAILFGWVVTKIIEEPLTAYGRQFTWSKQLRAK